MKKFLLVLLIGMVLALDICGIIKQVTIDKVEERDVIKETSTIVYMEQLMLFLLFFAKITSSIMKRKQGKF